MEAIPILFRRKEECCGCTACVSICPFEAISMMKDNEGFLYPYISKEKCICCRRCIRVCPMKSSAKKRTYNGGHGK
jgi:formate hydrogenlyase subunit 6/NADH:ubiquinone oxidoreductase subunit I